MTISSNTLFHFCPTLDILLKIISGGFHPTYCWEVIRATKKRSLSAGVPMISFCDIPLTKVCDHNEQYGKYGIGMSMEWADAKGLNPILYLHSNSMLSQSLLNLGDFILKAEKQYKDDINLEKSFDEFYQIFQYVKNYRGSYYTKGGDLIEDYKYYNEREWRYVVPANDENIIVEKGEYDKWRGELKNSKPLLSKYKLHFTANDINTSLLKKIMKGR